ncbi:kinase-like protein [Annulohypoxylon maeteangense]|uniref:kinase-like protein n=1 Tax=Annulohypoxylon maeteangense TaxID=1927788 RepID=UPI002008B488|nr:kinase-like protein [Annulohypoxylon maeteangense]KAI0882372.1 kinase-like protein [Annulohypoxylon maeteangense]
MELIPYTSRDGREIVLRHRNAIVVRDPSSQRLEIRGAPLTECPTCHQPLRPPSPERHFDAPNPQDSYVNPNYFRMLQAGLDADEQHTQHQPPPSPIRRLTQPTLPSGIGPRPHDVDEAEFISSSPAPQEGARIRRDAFSPNYFQRFFVEEQELGRGGKGVVLLVRHEIDGCPLGHFACKRVPVGDDHAWLEKVLIEVELLAKLSHPNLVSYRHVWLEDVVLNRFGPSVACAFILQQYCNGGDLLKYVIGDQPQQATKEQLKAQMRRRSRGTTERPQDVYASQRRLSFEEIYSLFKDITSGLTYLHGANYIHRDLKPSNCLLHHENGKLTCLISDFGEVQPGNAIRKSTGTTGTISYCAPEVLKRDAGGRFGNFTTKSDVFSLGMILYFLCFGRLPYLNANTIHEELEDIDLLRAEIADWKGFQDEKRERPDLPLKLYQLLKKMLALDPTERPSANEVLSVMSHESYNGGLRGRSTSPSGGLKGRIIQNLDSPIHPGTPLPDPHKHPSKILTSGENFVSPSEDSSPATSHSSQPNLYNSLQKYGSPSTPRHRPQAMTLSRSHEGFPRPSPDRGRSTGVAHPQLSPTLHAPLLLAPPAGPHETPRQRAQHLLIYLINGHTDSMVFTFRLLLFLIKILSLTRQCWPFTATLSVGIPLIGIAGVDMGIHRDIFVPSHERGLRKTSSALSHWRWGWRGSLILLALHFAALWLFSRLGVLCATFQDSWTDW